MPDGTVAKGTTQANGAILRAALDGSSLEVFAWGFRNPYGLAFGPDGKLYAADAGSDARGSRPIADSPDVLWLVERGAWHGWPDFFAGVPVTDPRFKPKNGPTALYVVDIGPIHYVRGPKGPEPQAFPGTGVVWRIGRKGT